MELHRLALVCYNDKYDEKEVSGLVERLVGRLEVGRRRLGFGDSEAEVLGGIFDYFCDFWNLDEFIGRWNRGF